MNRLDCRKSNLRDCTHSENLMNRDKNVNNTSGHKGISWDKSRNKWMAGIKVNYKRISLGRFDDIQDAIKAYQLGVKNYHGEYTFERGNI